MLCSLTGMCIVLIIVISSQRVFRHFSIQTECTRCLHTDNFGGSKFLLSAEDRCALKLPVRTSAVAEDDRS